MRMSNEDRRRLANHLTPMSDRIKDWLFRMFLLVAVIVILVLIVRLAR